MVNIFEYTDFRKFLQDTYVARKQKDARFSHRYIGLKLGVNSGYFAKIVQGDRNLSSELVSKFALFLGLKKKEADFFEIMVQYGQCKTHAEKKRRFEKMLTFKSSAVHLFGADQYELFDKWYNLAIREVIAVFPVNDDVEALCKLVMPAIKPAEAKRALELLLRLGLIRKGEQGTYERVEPVWSTGVNVQSMALNNFHIASLELAKGAFDLFTRDLRNMSTLTLSVSGDGYRKIEEEMGQFRRRLLDLASQSDFPDRVYHFNFSVFPISRFRVGVKP